MEFTPLENFIYTVGHLRVARGLAWNAEQKFNQLDKAAVFNPYIKRKLKIDFYDMGHLYSVIGILEYVGFDEISLCSVVWKTPPPIEKEGCKVSIDYDEIFEVKVL